MITDLGDAEALGGAEKGRGSDVLCSGLLLAHTSTSAPAAEESAENDQEGLVEMKED